MGLNLWTDPVCPLNELGLEKLK
ncbi:uncharacterized protein G2W53_039098 [Senna tora]|uniref:Uncharacterized protein n=1 Tax=Senna tora TaxID=362788 RepID=A0A834SN70_9FABA|nr:uncharacterized protein G2W53_039098 [Senna tora]